MFLKFPTTGTTTTLSFMYEAPGNTPMSMIVDGP